MITKYFTKVVVRFNPLGKEAKTARLFLSSIPPTQRLSGLSLKNELLNGASTASPLVKVTFKDKTELELNPTGITFQEVGNFFDRHSRKLRLKETIEA
ncbi:LAMI_0A03840g1_1 [Lachancea mirantina]|uniref:Large ribosomal subunit protein mL53 n=1 Tax=Lachancea mirantina TaxID=1230905 RepID=A0A1G4INM8_9SACH|nr:LAMI_0A03840g1_1 [Lachancea mirantina]